MRGGSRGDARDMQLRRRANRAYRAYRRIVDTPTARNYFNARVSEAATTTPMQRAINGMTGVTRANARAINNAPNTTDISGRERRRADLRAAFGVRG